MLESVRERFDLSEKKVCLYIELLDIPSDIVLQCIKRAWLFSFSLIACFDTWSCCLVFLAWNCDGILDALFYVLNCVLVWWIQRGHKVIRSTLGVLRSLSTQKVCQHLLVLLQVDTHVI